MAEMTPDVATITDRLFTAWLSRAQSEGDIAAARRMCTHENARYVKKHLEDGTGDLHILDLIAGGTGWTTSECHSTRMFMADDDCRCAVCKNRRRLLDDVGMVGSEKPVETKTDD